MAEHNQPSTKDYIVQYGVFLGKRFSIKQKQKFVNFVAEDFRSLGLNTQISMSSNKRTKSMNVYIGDLKKAKTIVVAHYDTPSKIIGFDVPYYPYDAKKSFQASNLKSMILPMILILLGMVYLVMFSRYINFSDNFLASIAIVAGISCLAILCMKTTLGFANSLNFNRNTASILIAREIAVQLKKTDDIAFVLSDHECTSHKGDDMLKEAMPTMLKDKLIVHLECLSDPKDIVIGYMNGNKSYAQACLSHLHHEQKNIKKFEEEELKQHSLCYYPKAISITGGELIENQLIVRNTRNSKELDISETFIKQMSDDILDFVRAI